MRVRKASEFSVVGKSVGFVIFFLVGAMPTATVHAAPATTDVMWKVDESGNPSGAWADEDHWDGGQVPGALKFAKFNLNTNRIGGRTADCWLLRRFQRIENDPRTPKGADRVLMRWPYVNCAPGLLDLLKPNVL